MTIRMNSRFEDIFSGVTPDTFTFSNASPEFSLIFTGPSRFVSAVNPDADNMVSLLKAARRAIYYERLSIQNNLNGGGDLSETTTDEVLDIVDSNILSVGLSQINVDTLTDAMRAELTAKLNELIASGAVPNTTTLETYISTLNDVSDTNELTNGLYSLVGMAQSFDPTVQVAQIPVGSIGYQGKTFVSLDSGSQVAVRMEKFLYSGGNLGKSLMKSSVYTNYLTGVTSGFDTPDSSTETVRQLSGIANSTSIADPYLVNLRSAIMKVPVGIGALYFDRQKQLCGSVYLEGCRIANLSTMLQTGSPTIMEDVDIMADRQLGIPEEEVYHLLAMLTT